MTITKRPLLSAKQPRRTKRRENSTDATRGLPLGVRALQRKLELELAMSKLPVDALRARNDIDLAVSSIDALMTGDSEHLSASTAANLSRLLESSKHLAEVSPRPRGGS